MFLDYSILKSKHLQEKSQVICNCILFIGNWKRWPAVCRNISLHTLLLNIYIWRFPFFHWSKTIIENSEKLLVLYIMQKMRKKKPLSKAKKYFAIHEDCVCWMVDVRLQNIFFGFCQGIRPPHLLYHIKHNNIFSKFSVIVQIIRAEWQLRELFSVAVNLNWRDTKTL